jgi:hypothetical protein
VEDIFVEELDVGEKYADTRPSSSFNFTLKLNFNRGVKMTTIQSGLKIERQRLEELEKSIQFLNKIEFAAEGRVSTPLFSHPTSRQNDVSYCL